MTATWDDRIDDVTDQWREEQAGWALAAEQVAAWSEAGRLCEGCRKECDLWDFTQHDGHGPDCPHGDKQCQLRVCDGVHADPTSHSVCETQAERDGRDAVEAAEAGRERWAEWHAEDGL